MATQKQETWHNLFNNFDGYDFDETKKELEEMNGCEFGELTEQAVWDYISRQEQLDWEDMFETLNKTEEKAYGWIICGTAGTWRGNFPAMNIFDNAGDMIRSITKDCDFIKVEYSTKGKLRITAAHHDGTHCFECKLLNYNGHNTYDEWYTENRYYNLSEYQILEKLYNSNFYTRLPRI